MILFKTHKDMDTTIEAATSAGTIAIQVISNTKTR